VREDYDDGKAFIFYQHMRTPGLSELFYKGLQQDPGIFMTKGAVMGVAKNGDGMIVDAENTLLGEKLQVKADLVVLGAGMVPVTKDDPVVNLAYRQGPGFRDIGLFNGYCGFQLHLLSLRNPAHRHLCRRGHPSLHDHGRVHGRCLRCGPQGHPVPGVGQPRRQRSSALRRHDLPGFLLPALHPVQTLHRRVPLRRLDDDEKGTPKPNPTRCRRCGTCMGACPERIIGFADYNIDSIGSMVKAVGVPSEDDYDRTAVEFWGWSAKTMPIRHWIWPVSTGCPTRPMCA
jgi:quinone-modifying oxidoreductase subunit QmoB